MGQDADGEAEARRRIDELLARPDSTGIRDMAKGLYDAVVAEFAGTEPRNGDALFRMCVGTVILADWQGMRRQREVTETTRATLDAVTRIAELRKEWIAVKDQEVAGLTAVVDEQREVIESLSSALKALRGRAVGEEAATPPPPPEKPPSIH